MAATKEYIAELKKMSLEADKILTEFRTSLGADWAAKKKEMEEQRKQMGVMQDVIASMERDQQLGKFTKSNKISPEVKGMLKHMAKEAEYVVPSEYKAASIGNPSTGGYFAVPEFVDKVTMKIYDRDSILQNADVVNVNSSLVQFPYEASDAAAHWVGEKESRNKDDSGSVGLANIPMNTVIAKVKVTRELLDNADIPMEQYLINQVSDKIQRAVGSAFVSGNGFKKPMGVFTNTDIPSVTTTGSGTVKVITVEDIISLYGKLPSEAEPSAAFYMSKKAFTAVAKLKGADNLYMLPQGIAPGLPPTILGFPVRLCASAPDNTAAGNVPMILGDMHTAYKIIQGKQMTYQRDDYTAADDGQVVIRFNGYYGGQVVMPDALVRMVMGS